MKRKWNWIDTTIIFIVILAIVVFLNRDKFKQANVGGGSNRKNIVITVEGSDITADMVTDLKIGDKIFSQNSIQNATVEDIQISPKENTKVGADGRIITYEDAQEATVTVTINAEVVTSGPYMDLGGQEVKVGVPFIMKTTQVEFPADIKHIEVN